MRAAPPRWIGRVLVAWALACGDGPVSPPPSDDLDDDGLADLEEEAILQRACSQ